MRAQPSYGSVGQVVKLWGHVAGATRVTFDGTPTTFAVISSSEITTTVPTGARSGAVQVVTPRSPLGLALLGKRAGDDGVVTVAGKVRELSIVSVQ